ncbi:hypothetical protein [Tatumella saanichensis]|uniref:hypothetical protein n=1 Tax=Tatumella saanichensis TaxID=480813 RepID=UPI0004A31AD9|nr:hypothetical protein [Tatumella saanichensis]
MNLSPEESAVLSRLPERYRDIETRNVLRMAERERKEWLVRQRIVMGCMDAVEAANNGQEHPQLNQMVPRTLQRIAHLETSIRPPAPQWIVDKKREKVAEGWHRAAQNGGIPGIIIPTANTQGRGGFGD